MKRVYQNILSISYPIFLFYLLMSISTKILMNLAGAIGIEIGLLGVAAFADAKSDAGN